MRVVLFCILHAPAYSSTYTRSPPVPPLRRRVNHTRRIIFARVDGKFTQEIRLIF